jgi:glycosyltransferase involved in cell wall biosynthesis
MGAGLKPKIVLSGVNFTGLGPLTVFQEAIESLASQYSMDFEIIALVHKADLFQIPNVTFIQYPSIKSSWFRRIKFEYWECRRISERIRPYLWFAMHDMTPSVHAQVRAVYCHNPSPFYRFSLEEAMLDWKFGLFTLFYRFLYQINIKSNNFIVVQQDWLRSEFQARYGVRNVIVAHPPVNHLKVSPQESGDRQRDHPYRFFYPAFPRTFKNFEQILSAAHRLEESGFDRFELWLTISGAENSYAKRMFREFSSLTTVRWLGLLPLDEVMLRYKDADCLLFPSKLETWGMPITEFKATGKPILAIDLPYSHETVGDYAQAAFFPSSSNIQLAAMMREAANRGSLFEPAYATHIAQPYARNWPELWKILLER